MPAAVAAIDPQWGDGRADVTPGLRESVQRPSSSMARDRQVLRLPHMPPMFSDSALQLILGGGDGDRLLIVLVARAAAPVKYRKLGPGVLMNKTFVSPGCGGRVQLGGPLATSWDEGAELEREARC